MNVILQDVPFLYRGDSIKEKDFIDLKDEQYNSKKKEVLHNLSNCVCAKELFGGNSLDIYKPLKYLINRHVDEEWDKSHFISFTSEIKRAKQYALNLDRSKDAENEFCYLDECTRLDNWDCLIITIKLSELKPVFINAGIYRCYYNTHEVLLINISEAMNSIKGINQETLRKSQVDSEWLIMSLDPMPDTIGLSSLLYLPKDSEIKYYSRNY